MNGIDTAAHSKCQNVECSGVTAWIGKAGVVGGHTNVLPGGSELLVFPIDGSGPPPHKHLADGPRKTFREARAVLPYSARAAGGLMRLCLDEVISEQLNLTRGTLNERIGTLIGNGLPPAMGEALATPALLQHGDRRGTWRLSMLDSLFLSVPDLSTL